MKLGENNHLISEQVLFLKYQLDQIEIVDFLPLAMLWACLLFFAHPLLMYISLDQPGFIPVLLFVRLKKTRHMATILHSKTYFTNFINGMTKKNLLTLYLQVLRFDNSYVHLKIFSYFFDRELKTQGPKRYYVVSPFMIAFIKFCLICLYFQFFTCFFDDFNVFQYF